MTHFLHFQRVNLKFLLSHHTENSRYNKLLTIILNSHYYTIAQKGFK